MKRYLLSALLVLAICLPAFTQTITTVTATVLDKNGVPFVKCTVLPIFVNVSGGATPTITATAGNLVPPTTAVICDANGLWQIYLQDHPEFAGLDLRDPATNANAAFSVYSNAGRFRPWSGDGWPGPSHHGSKNVLGHTMHLAGSVTNLRHRSGVLQRRNGGEDGRTVGSIVGLPRSPQLAGWTDFVLSP